MSPPLALQLPPSLTFSSPPPSLYLPLKPKFHTINPIYRVKSSPIRSPPINATSSNDVKPNYELGSFDFLLLDLFRKKMVDEVGWDSDKAGYDGLIEVANHLMMKGRTDSETAEAAIRILRSLFPPFLLELFQMLIAPLAKGKLAAIMVARVTTISCQWLMGRCTVNSVDLPDGSSLASGVLVEKCKYLEESKCLGICINTCKLPTQLSMYMVRKRLSIIEIMQGGPAPMSTAEIDNNEEQERRGERSNDKNSYCDNDFLHGLHGCPVDDGTELYGL